MEVSKKTGGEVETYWFFVDVEHVWATAGDAVGDGAVLATSIFVLRLHRSNLWREDFTLRDTKLVLLNKSRILSVR